MYGLRVCDRRKLQAVVGVAVGIEYLRGHGDIDNDTDGCRVTSRMGRSEMAVDEKEQGEDSRCGS